MKRSFLTFALLAAIGALLPRGAAGAGLKPCTDYRGKGRVRVLLQPDLETKAGDPKNEMGFHMEQVFLGPDRMLLNVDMYGIRQQMLAEGNVEQTYQPAMGMIIEKKYRNLDKADENPIVAIQTSIVDVGRKLREAKSAHGVGHEKVLDFDCEVLEADSREVVEKLNGLVSPGKSNGLLDGKLMAWMVAGFGVPVKLEMYTAAGNLAMALTMEELRFNTGVKPEDMRLSAPAGTKKVSIDVDVAAKDWQQKMNEDLRKAVAGVGGERPRS
jgi:outer membrane lipoprotein-sorting protein